MSAATTAPPDRPDVVTAPLAPRLVDRRWAQVLGERGALLVLLGVTVLLVMVPVGFVLRESLGDGADGVRRMLEQPQFRRALTTTLAFTVGSVALAVVLGTTLAWLAHGLPPRWRWLGSLPLFPLVIPHLALLIGFMFMLNPRIGYLNAMLRWLPGIDGPTGPLDIFTVPWMIVFIGLGASAFMYLFVRSALAQLHQDLVDAAAACGAGPIRTFWKVVVPLLRPALIYGTLTVTLMALGQFTTPLFLGRQKGVQVLTTEMFYRLNSFPPDRPLASAYGLTVVFAGVLLLAVQRVLLRNQKRYVTVGGRGIRSHRQRGAGPAIALAAYGLLTVVLPLVSLLIVSFQPLWSKDIVVEDFTWANYSTVFGRDDLTAAIRNSLVYALWAMLVTLPLGYLCARVIYARSKRRVLANAQDLVVSLPIGVPSVIFGVGFLLAFASAPIQLYGRPLGLIVVYVTLMLPFATRLQLTALTSLGDDLRDAAAASGAGVLRRTLAVDLPLLRPALGAAAALVVVMTSHEFSASVLVRSRNTPILGPVVYDLWTYGSYPLTAVMALIMCVVTGVGVALAMLLGGGRGALRGFGQAPG